MKILDMIVTMIDRYQYTFAQPIECTIQTVNPGINQGLCVGMACWCGFISCNKYAILVSDVDNRESQNVWEQRVYGEISVSSS